MSSDAGDARSRALHAKLTSWYLRVRRDLPWRRTGDPYAVWVSETMLQQTRVETVVPYYERFLRALPTIASLAEAPEERVLALWNGLGYYRRARMLHAAARRVVESHGGELPREASALRSLEGVGAYTAGAIASIAFGRSEALVDGNVARVLSRVFAIHDDLRTSTGMRRVWEIAEHLVPRGAGAKPGDWNQALMELGATICLPRTPSCPACPIRSECDAFARGAVGDLPRLGPKKAPRPVNRVAVVLASSTAILLARRRAGALFGGIWEPPGADGDALSLLEWLSVRASDVESVGSVVHVLSHRRMTVRVLRGELRGRRRHEPTGEYDAVERVAWKRLTERATGALTRKILEVANVAPRGLRLT